MTRGSKEGHGSDSTKPRSATEVLVVDDDVELAEIYADWLRDRYAVRTVHSGSEALDRVDASVDVVLLDRHMTDLSGEEVLARLRRRECDCSVAMVTAVEPDFDIVRLAFDEYVTKPVTREEIRHVVDSLVTRRRYDERVDELFSLVRKRAVLMAEKSTAELQDSEAYRELVREIQTVNAELDGLVYGLSARDTEALFAQLDARQRGCADV